MALGGLVLGSLILYLKGMRIIVFQLSASTINYRVSAGLLEALRMSKKRFEYGAPVSLSHAVPKGPNYLYGGYLPKP